MIFLWYSPLNCEIHEPYHSLDMNKCSLVPIITISPTVAHDNHSMKFIQINLAMFIPHA